MSIVEVTLSRDVDVRELAVRIGKDIGGISNLTTTNKESVVSAINEVMLATVEAGDVYATKDEISNLATKPELTQAIADLIDGADADSDTLKELADKITALAQGDNGLVSALEAQGFTVEQKEQARSNIDAASTSELEAQKVDLLEDIATATAPLATKEELEDKAEKAPEGDEYALVSSLPGLVAPYATKDELTQAITDLIDGAGADSDTLKELADKITALAQADNGLVSAEAAQTFDEAQQQQARDNIGAISEADVNDILEAQSGGDYVTDYLQAGL